MNTVAIDNSRLAAIHAESKKAGLDDASRRDLMQAVTGKRSSKDMTPAEADRVIERLKGLSKGHETAPKTSSQPERLTVTGPYASKFRALWLSGYNLGVIQDKTDAALIRFAEAQTGIPHTRWIRAPKDASAVIEGLRAWLAREGGVVWPSDRRDFAASKKAIVTAQLRRLADIAGGRYEPRSDRDRQIILRATDALAAGADLDAAASALGTLLRRERKRRQ